MNNNLKSLADKFNEALNKEPDLIESKSLIPINIGIQSDSEQIFADMVNVDNFFDTKLLTDENNNSIMSDKKGMVVGSVEAINQTIADKNIMNKIAFLAGVAFWLESHFKNINTKEPITDLLTEEELFNKRIFIDNSIPFIQEDVSDIFRCMKESNYYKNNEYIAPLNLTFNKEDNKTIVYLSYGLKERQ